MTNSENAPSPAARLAEARLKRWHQNGEALLTLENMRSWINAAGLVLFTHRPQIAAPAPSMVEAMLGAPNTTPTLQQITDARGLLARLAGEGLAVPLNLLGTHTGIGTDTPDFVVSSAVFSYVFTLRGDKAWKQPPVTSGPTKVSNLALAAYQLISQRHAMTASELATELGKEVTESAVLRALTELWTQLRVLPLPQADGATMWELASTRYTKQIKAGANAGLPTALSALISLYLGQALIATQEEIETFLSPLAPRSRIRDVIHALLAARQLDTYTLEGRSLLHVAGAAPGFLSGSTQQSEPAPTKPEPAEEVSGEEPVHEEDTSRIKKFVPKPRKIGTGYLAKAKPAAFSTRPGGRPKFERREQERGERPRRTEQSDRERRPFQRTHPEDRERRPFGQSTPREGRGEQRGRDRRDMQDRPKRPFTPRSDREREFERRPGRREGEARPYKARAYERPRAEEQGPAERPTYRRFDEPHPKRGPKPFAQERRPRTFEAGKPPREGERRQNAPAGRPDRREFGERQRPRDRAASSQRPDRRNFGERPDRRDRISSGERPNRRDFGAREGRRGDRPFANQGGRPSAKFGGKPGKFGGKPFGKKPGQKAGPPRKFRPREDESA